MNVQQLRDALADLPDYYDVVVERPSASRAMCEYNDDVDLEPIAHVDVGGGWAEVAVVLR